MDELTREEMVEYIDYLDSRLEALYAKSDEEPDTKKAEGAYDSDGPIPLKKKKKGGVHQRTPKGYHNDHRS